MQYLHIIPARQAHIQQVCGNLRGMDQQELAVFHNIPLEQTKAEALRQCTARPHPVYAVLNAQGEAVAIFGKEPVAQVGTGLWMLATAKLSARALLHHTRHLLHQWSQEQSLFCVLWSGQQATLRFLRHLGFAPMCETVQHNSIFICLVYNRRG